MTAISYSLFAFKVGHTLNMLYWGAGGLKKKEKKEKPCCNKT